MNTDLVLMKVIDNVCFAPAFLCASLVIIYFVFAMLYTPWKLFFDWLGRFVK